MPIAARSEAVAPALASALRAARSWVCQISSASCSTQPGCGKCCVNSIWSTAAIAPSRSNRIAREEVVPWSRAITYRLIGTPEGRARSLELDRRLDRGVLARCMARNHEAERQRDQEQHADQEVGVVERLHRARRLHHPVHQSA